MTPQNNSRMLTITKKIMSLMPNCIVASILIFNYIKTYSFAMTIWIENNVVKDLIFHFATYEYSQTKIRIEKNKRWEARV